MFSKLIDALFGCIHANYSLPRTLKPVRNSNGVPSEPRTYVVCLDCGKDLPYDLDKMKVIKVIKGKKKKTA